MGYAYVPDLKDENVVCQQPCNHRDCKLTREQWTGAKCSICTKPMEAGQAFYFVGEKNEIAHAHCVWKEEEERRERIKNNA